MKNLTLLAALLGASAIVPALSLPAAAVTDHNVVPLSITQTDADWRNFRDPVSSISFMSRGNDVDCDNVTVHYLDDGTSQAIFSGTLFAGERQTVTFPARQISNVHFRCHADHAGGASLDLTANMVGGGPLRESGYVAPYEVPMARQNFGRWSDHSVMIDDSPDVRAIALQPRGADAQCRNVTASFNDGSSLNLPVNGGRTMEEGRIYNVPINGRFHGLNAVGLTCEAENGPAVTMNIYGIG